MLKDFKVFKGNWNYYFRIINRLKKRNVELEHHTHLRAIGTGDFFIPGRPPLRRENPNSIRSITRSLFSRNRTPGTQSPTPPPAFMVPPVTNRPFRFTKRQWEEFESEFWIGYNAAQPPLTPEEKFAAQARDLKKHILATVTPKKRRLALLNA